MKLVWCPEIASKAYLDGVRALAGHDDLTGSPEVAELVSAMAGGWNAQLVVEAPDVSCSSSSDASSSPSPSSRRPAAATSLALAAAARRTGGRYACVLPDAVSAAAYAAAQQAGAAAVVVGEAKEAMARLEGVDFLVVDARRRDAEAVLRAARPGPRGMVVVRHGDGARRRGGAATTALAAASMAAGTRVVRSVYLPVGRGVEVLHVGVGKGPSLRSRSTRAAGRWIRHVNHDTGEEHVFRRQ